MKVNGVTEWCTLVDNCSLALQCAKEIRSLNHFFPQQLSNSMYFEWQSVFSKCNVDSSKVYKHVFFIWGEFLCQNFVNIIEVIISKKLTCRR